MNERLKAIIGGAELASIHLVETKASLHAQNMELEGAFSWRLDADKTQSRGDFDAETRLLICGVRFYLTAYACKRESPLVEVFCEYSLLYTLAEGIECSDEDAAEFAALNGSYNAWPFFREHVQSMTAKMSVPPIILPLRRFQGPATRLEK